MKRVKTGCITCRLRRVKCDEGKPNCTRCTGTGRKCDGYGPVTRKRNVSPSSGSTIAQYSATPGTSLRHLQPRTKVVQEQFEIEEFCREKATRIFYHNSQEFWQRSVLQLAQHEPAIWHAILAMDHIYRRIELDSRHSPECQSFRSGWTTDLGLIHRYNKAISALLQKRSIKSDTDTIIVLISCILFTCIEFLKGDPEPALTHLRGGWHILNDSVMSFSRPSRTGPPPSAGASDSQQGIFHEVLLAFKRLRLQSLLVDPLVNPPPLTWTALSARQADFPGTGFRFNGIEDARELLFVLSHEAMSLVYNTTSFRYTGLLESSHFVCQRRLGHAWLSWQYGMEHLTLEKAAFWSLKEKRIAKTLTMLAITQKIWTACCLTPFQTSFDAWFGDFKTIVDLGMEVVEGGIDSFQCDPGVIMPLHTTAYKCRHPVIRRQALKLLGSGRWREGSFTNAMSYRWCHKILEIEEQNVDFHPGQTSFDEALPAEAARIHVVGGGREPRAGYQIRILMMPTPWNPHIVDIPLVTTGELPPVPPLTS